MEVYLLIAAIVLTVWLYPYARAFFKRLAMFRKLRRICKTKGYLIHPVHRLWLFGRRTSRSCDFYIETPDTVYAVKLFGMKKRTQNLIIRGDSFVIRHFIGIIGKVSVARIPVDSKPHPMPDYNFRLSFRDEWYRKAIRPVLLLNPACLEVWIEKNHREILIGNSEAFSGMTLFTLAGFLGELEGFS